MRMHHRGLMSVIKRVCHKPESGAEIGVYKGETVGVIHRRYPQCRMTLVDPWQPPARYAGWQNGKMGVLTQEEWDAIYDEAVNNILSSGGPTVTYVMTSAEAAARTPDKSLDFVFIDADHTYEGLKEDIRLWLPKARRLLCGHDYGGKLDRTSGWGITRALDESFGLENVLKHAGLIWGYAVPQQEKNDAYQGCFG